MHFIQKGESNLKFFTESLFVAESDHLKNPLEKKLCFHWPVLSLLIKIFAKKQFELSFTEKNHLKKVATKNVHFLIYGLVIFAVISYSSRIF